MELQKICEKWNLTDPVLQASTHTSEIFKVQHGDQVAVLKILNTSGLSSESSAAMVLRYLNGAGSVRLLQADSNAHLLEFIDGSQLKNLCDQNQDDEACGILCDVLDQIHNAPGSKPTQLRTVGSNFKSLFAIAHSDPIYAKGAQLAEWLIANEKEATVLHGDIHHENIMKSSSRGWLAIDPKGLVGERTYDVANSLYNPEPWVRFEPVRECIERRSKIFAHRLRLEHHRVLQYAFAFGCLRAAWQKEDRSDETGTLQIAKSIYKLISDR